MYVKRSTGHTHTHATAEQTTHTNTERATAQRRVIVEVVVAAPKIVVVRFAAKRRPLALGRRGTHVCEERCEQPWCGAFQTQSKKLGGLSSTLGVTRCGRSAGCVLCALWAVTAAVCGGGYPVGVSISPDSYA